MRGFGESMGDTRPTTMSIEGSRWKAFNKCVTVEAVSTTVVRMVGARNSSKKAFLCKPEIRKEKENDPSY